MTHSTDHIIDKDQRFSHSKFWQGQREFYHEKGLEAWASEVPFYITSNPFIGHHYAEMLVRFIQDWTNKYPPAEEVPFYVLELGAGSGQFSFYLLKSLKELVKKLGLTSVKIRYLMTDFTQNNVDPWRQNPQLNEFVKEGLLDFAVFDFEKDDTIRTTEHQLILQPKTLHNPLIVIANYLFDSIVADVFFVKNKKLHESLLTLRTQKSNENKTHIKKWQHVKIHHTEKAIQENYYQDKILDEILYEYTETIKQSYLLYPIGCLMGLNRLKNLSDGKLFLISSDKGLSTLQELNNQSFPEIDFHGSFSLMVNYHAISRFFELQHGQAFLQTPRDGLTTAVFSLGFKLSDLPETHYLLEESVEGFSPTDFFNYYELVESGAKNMRLNALASTLCVSRWDPFVFEIISEILCKLFSKEDSEVIDYICNNLPKIRDNFYFVPGCDDVLFSMGYLLYSIDRFEEAINYYLESRKYFKDNFEVLYNLGLCYFYQEKYVKALKCFEEALVFEPKNKDVANLIRRCKKQK